MARMQNFWIYSIAAIALISAINYICHNCIEAPFAKILSVIGYIIILLILELNDSHIPKFIKLNPSHHRFCRRSHHCDNANHSHARRSQAKGSVTT